MEPPSGFGGNSKDINFTIRIKEESDKRTEKKWHPQLKQKSTVQKKKKNYIKRGKKKKKVMKHQYTGSGRWVHTSMHVCTLTQPLDEIDQENYPGLQRSTNRDKLINLLRPTSTKRINCWLSHDIIFKHTHLPIWD